MPCPPLPPELTPPLDFSFQPLQSLDDLHPAGSPSPSRGLRLAYEGLGELWGLPPTLQRLLAAPTQLRWLDLSFNRLTAIDPVLGTMEGLQSLSLHGNAVSRLDEVDKLRALRRLRRLTLHGNPMEEEQGYRRYVLALLPWLRRLDFSAVTRQERSEAAARSRPRGRGAPP
ncbi:leucine-rich repeat-containing protein 51 [Mergus octosetaceus]